MTEHPLNNCSNGHRCKYAFSDWIETNFDVEPNCLWKSTQKGRSITHTRIWPDRPDFVPGDLVISGASLGSATTMYQVLARLGTPKKPHYDLRIVYSACPSAKNWAVNRVGTISRNQAGNAFLLCQPKNKDTLVPFHCIETHVPESEWNEYIPPQKIKTKRRKIAK